MVLIYTTLNNTDEARSISKEILEKKLANCTNWFPINCMYNWEEKIEEEPEVVLIVKTHESKYEDVKKLIQSKIDYTNFIGAINVENINPEFSLWLGSIVQE